ncbi:MAG: hypothetical protein R3C11_28485 [Planctomycetaceae bacterium]
MKFKKEYLFNETIMQGILVMVIASMAAMQAQAVEIVAHRGLRMMLPKIRWLR